MNENEKATRLNNGNNGQPKKFNGKVAVGAAAGAAVLGVGGTAAAMHFNNDDEQAPEENTDAMEEEIVIGDDNFNPDAPIEGGGLGSVFSVFSSSTTTTEEAAQQTESAAQAQHTAPHRQHHSSHSSHTQNSANSQTQHDNNNNEENGGGHNNNNNEDDNHGGGDTENGVPDIDDIQPISPDEILSETSIDIDDNEIPELLSFDTVELVDDDQGNVHVQAEFTMEGENYTMIDIDNDGVFDSVADASGNDMGTAGGMMISDIELINNANNDNYLSANEYDNNTDLSGTGESSLQDTIDV